MNAEEYVVEKLVELEHDYEIEKTKTKNLFDENKELKEVLSIIKKHIEVKDNDISFFVLGFGDGKEECKKLSEFFGLDLSKGE